MKITDLLESRKQVNELGTTPMGFGQRLATTAMAKLGSTTAQAKLDVGKRANELENTFKQWALRSGVDLQKVPKRELSMFLQQQRLPDMPFKQAVYNFNDAATSKKVWMAVSQNAFKQGGSSAGTEPLGRTYGLRPSGGKGNLAKIQGMLAGLTPAERAALKKSL